MSLFNRSSVSVIGKPMVGSAHATTFYFFLEIFIRVTNEQCDLLSHKDGMNPTQSPLKFQKKTVINSMVLVSNAYMIKQIRAPVQPSTEC